MNIYVLQNDLKKNFKLPVDVLHVLTDKYTYQILTLFCTIHNHTDDYVKNT